MTIQVLLADDHAILRDGLRAILESQPDIKVVGGAEDGRQVLAMAQKIKPDIILMDIAMPQLNGIDAAEQILAFHPDIRIIMLSMHSTSEYIQRAFRAGAKGYLLKDSAGQEVVQAVRKVFEGHFFISQKISDTIFEFMFTVSPQTHSTSSLDKLSMREREVLQLVTEGKTSLEIAEILNLSPKSVDTYRSRIMQKLEISDIASLVKYAIKHGVISLDG